MHVVSDEGDHLGPIELMTDNRLGDTRVSSQVTVMVGAKDVQSDILIVRDIEQSLVAKEVAILLERPRVYHGRDGGGRVRADSKVCEVRLC